MNRYQQLKQDLEQIFNLDIIDLEDLNNPKMSIPCCIYLKISTEEKTTQSLSTVGHFIINGSITLFSGHNCKATTGYLNNCIINGLIPSYLSFNGLATITEDNIEGIPIRNESMDFVYYATEHYNQDKLKEVK